jgi:hypothetical protein
MMSAIYQKHKDKEDAQKYYVCHCTMYNRNLGFCDPQCPRLCMNCECERCTMSECITDTEDSIHT